MRTFKWIYIALIYLIGLTVMHFSAFGESSIGFSSDKGTSNVQTLSFSSKSSVKSERQELSFPMKVKYVWVDGQSKLSRGDFTLKYDYDFIKTYWIPWIDPNDNNLYLGQAKITSPNYWSFFFFGNYGWNEARGVKNRYQGGIGAKYTLNDAISTSLGLLAQSQNNGDNSARLSFRPKIKRGRLALVGFYQPDIEDFNDYYLIGKASIDIATEIKRIGLRISSYYDYDSRPENGIEKLGYGGNFSIIIK